MSAPLDELISISQQTERLLERRFNAQGRGLREKLDSVASQIPPQIQKQIRFIATTRNKAAHGGLENAPLKLRAVRKAFDDVRSTLAPSASAQNLGRRGARPKTSQPTESVSVWRRLFGLFSGAHNSSFARLDAIAKETERLLTRYYKAQGRGLHDKLSSVASRLPENAQRKIRFIATIRNKAAHESLLVADENIAKVEEAFAAIRPTLDRGAPLRKFAFWVGAALFVAFATFVAYRAFF